MTTKWFRVLKTYEKPHGGFLAHGPRYAGVVSEDSLTVLFTHPGDPSWHEVVDIAHLEEAPDPPLPRRRRKLHRKSLGTLQGGRSSGGGASWWGRTL